MIMITIALDMMPQEVSERADGCREARAGPEYAQSPY